MMPAVARARRIDAWTVLFVLTVSLGLGAFAGAAITVFRLLARV